MNRPSHILLLAGSFESRRVAEGLAATGQRYTALITEPPRGPSPMPQSPILRRFTGSDAMADWMEERAISAVIDASHVFDRTQTDQAVAACAMRSLPYLRLERPAWQCRGPRCQQVPDIATAIAAAGDRVFAATGWDSLAAMRHFGGEVIFLRQTRRHDRPAPLRFVSLSFGDPPFDRAHEVSLFRDLRIDTLICRNLGGAASRPKVDAALALGLAVIFINRPALPTAINVTTDPEEAIRWASA